MNTELKAAKERISLLERELADRDIFHNSQLEMLNKNQEKLDNDMKKTLHAELAVRQKKHGFRRKATDCRGST